MKAFKSRQFGELIHYQTTLKVADIIITGEFILKIHNDFQVPLAVNLTLKIHNDFQVLQAVNLTLKIHNGFQVLQAVNDLENP